VFHNDQSPKNWGNNEGMRNEKLRNEKLRNEKLLNEELREGRRDRLRTQMLNELFLGAETPLP
jgi:hypothetical protein